MVYKHGWDLQVLQNVINHLLVCFKVSAELKHFVKHFITNITVQMFLHVHIICCFVSALNITKLAFNFTMISFLVSVQRSQVFKRNATLFTFKMIWHMLLPVTVLGEDDPTDLTLNLYCWCLFFICRLRFPIFLYSEPHTLQRKVEAFRTSSSLSVILASTSSKISTFSLTIILPWISSKSTFSIMSLSSSFFKSFMKSYLYSDFGFAIDRSFISIFRL